MKPSDCKSMQDVESLQEQGLALNNYNIIVDSSGVMLTIDPYCRIKINHRKFRLFAEWYLADQKPASEENNLLEENPDQNLSGW